MHPELIKAHLRMRHTTPAAIADDLGVTRAAVANAIHGKSKSPRIRQRIAQTLGKPISELWPEGAAPVPGVRRRRPVKPQVDAAGFPLGATVIGSDAKPRRGAAQ